MSCGGGCGGGPTYTNRRGEKVAKRVYFDPTQALFAAATPRFVVLANAGATSGKRFATKAAADDYARAIGGIVRSV